VSAWGIMKGEERRAFGDEEIERALLLSPHIRRAVEITDPLRYQRVHAGTLQAALDAFLAAAIIVE
jgi:hypothetical protein